MNLPRLVDSQGRPYPLGSMLADGKGGEGMVFATLNDPKRVVKVYNSDRLPLDANRLQRLTYQVTVKDSQLIALTGWPTELVFDAANRKPVGFSMPKADGTVIWKLYQPQERLKSFPKATWEFQLHAAMNLAAVFEEIHRHGYLVGDVSLKNVLIALDATVKVIDCDSFQVRTPNRIIPCPVGTREYVPPELQDKPWDGERTENHDRFGMAVLIYQLLFVGRHPYAGIYRGPGEPSPSDDIREFRFAQGPAAHTWHMSPPPLTPTFEDIPPELGNLFRRAFERGSQNGTRPTPNEWYRQIKATAANIATCPADSGHKYWKGANDGCVWCRLARNGGPEYYYGAADTGGPFVVDEARLNEVLRRLEAAALIGFPSLPIRPKHESRNIGRPIPKEILQLKRAPLPEDELEEEIPPTREQWSDHVSITTGFGVIIAIGLLLLPFGFYRGFLACGGILLVATFGIWIVIHLRTSGYAKAKQLYAAARRRNRQAKYEHEQRYWDELEAERDRRANSYEKAKMQIADVEKAWSNCVAQYAQRHRELRIGIENTIRQCRELQPAYRSEIQRLTASAEASARHRHLQYFSLTMQDNLIPGVGPRRRQILSDRGINTAADLEESKILRIDGFGPVLTRALMDWKQDVLRSFRFDASTVQASPEHNAASLRFGSQQKTLLNMCEQQLKELSDLAPNCRATLTRLEQELGSKLSQVHQAQADLQVIQLLIADA